MHLRIILPLFRASCFRITNNRQELPNYLLLANQPQSLYSLIILLPFFIPFIPYSILSYNPFLYPLPFSPLSFLLLYSPLFLTPATPTQLSNPPSPALGKDLMSVNISGYYRVFGK